MTIAPEVPGMVFQAGNLAMICLRGGRYDAAAPLVAFQRIMEREPFEAGDPLIEEVLAELAVLRRQLVAWFGMPSNLWN